MCIIICINSKTNKQEIRMNTKYILLVTMLTEKILS